MQLETVAQMEQHSDAIARLVEAKVMPPGNATGITDEERVELVAWAKAPR